MSRTAPAATATAEVLTIDEVAKVLRLDRKVVYDMASRNRLPGARKFGHVYRVHKAVLIRWMEAAGNDRS